MDLKTYALQHDGSAKLSPGSPTLARVAESCDVTPGFIYQVALGHKAASSELACHIEYATEGWVNRRITLPSFPWDRPAEQAA